MTPERVLRFEVPSRELLEEMATQPLPFELREIDTDMRFFRVVHFDTAGAELEQKGVTIRLQIDDRGAQTLLVEVREHETSEGALVRRGTEAEVSGIAFYNYGHLRQANLGWIKDALAAFEG